MLTHHPLSKVHFTLYTQRAKLYIRRVSVLTFYFFLPLSDVYTVRDFYL